MYNILLVDSGIGGLSLAEIIQKNRPDVNIHYVADEKYMPYGSKNIDFIIERGKTFAKYFNDKVDIYTIACNTLSMCAYEEIKEVFVGKVIDIINPTCEFVAEKEKVNKVGILATKNTIDSHIYSRSIKKHNNKIEVIEKEANAYVALAEHPLWFDLNEKKQIIEYRVFEFVKKNVKDIVLGCTHFPSLIEDIRRAFPYEVRIFSSSELGAIETLKNINVPKSDVDGGLFLYTTGDDEVIKSLIDKWYSNLKVSEIIKLDI